MHKKILFFTKLKRCEVKNLPTPVLGLLRVDGRPNCLKYKLQKQVSKKKRKIKNGCGIKLKLLVAAADV